MKLKLFRTKLNETNNNAHLFTQPDSSFKNVQTLSMNSLSTAASTALSMNSQSLASIDSDNDISKSRIYTYEELLAVHQQMALELITVISEELEMQASKSDSEKTLSSETQLFCSKVPPDIPIHIYIHRIVSTINRIYDYRDPEATDMNGTGMRCLIMTMIYLERIKKINPSLEMNVLNVHRLVFSAFMCALKFSEDEVPPTSFLAMLGGVSIEQFKICEARMINCMKFRFYLNGEELHRAFANYCIRNEIDYQPSEFPWD